jgi:hypothetical protein
MTRFLRSDLRRARPGLPVLALAFLLLASLAGCDRGRSGPGGLEGVLQGPVPVGSAFLVVSGRGVEGVEGTGGTLAFSSQVDGEASTRVVLIAPEGGAPLRFRVQVRDRAAGLPSVTLVELFDAGNVRIQGTDGYRIEFQP